MQGLLQVDFYAQPVIDWAAVSALISVSAGEVCVSGGCTIVDVVPVDSTKASTVYDSATQKVNITLLKIAVDTTNLRCIVQLSPS